MTIVGRSSSPIYASPSLSIVEQSTIATRGFFAINSLGAHGRISLIRKASSFLWNGPEFNIMASFPSFRAINPRAREEERASPSGALCEMMTMLLFFSISLRMLLGISANILSILYYPWRGFINYVVFIYYDF